MCPPRGSWESLLPGPREQSLPSSLAASQPLVPSSAVPYPFLISPPRADQVISSKRGEKASFPC